VIRKDKNILIEAGSVFIGLLLMALFVVLCFLLPFCLYWLNRSYKIEKERQKKDEELKKDWVEYFSVKEEYKYPPIFIKIKIDVPFCPDGRQVIYIESQYNVPLNNYILKEYAKIVATFAKRGYTFIHIPLLMNKVTQYGNNVVKYAYPQLNDSDILPQDGDFVRQTVENILLFVDEPLHLNGGLIRYKKTEDNHHFFSYYQFEIFEESEIWEQFRAYIKMIGDSYDGPLYSLGTPEKEIKADYDFPIEAEKLMEEIKERIKQLRQTGIGEMIIKSLFKFDDTVKLSRVLITKDYRIFLPDYNNMEITMTPLPKAVYFLYLKHPEGIMFKHLVDYKDELKGIYMQISNREDLKKMLKSIDDIVDSTQNAINEKCSRIREAFIGKFDESLAKNYFIIGERLEPKRITLERQLVVWE